MTLRQAVLLVGGRGTRMWPLTASRPKGLLPVAGIPFVELQLAQLAAAGIEEVILAIGTVHERAWEEYVADRTGRPSVHLSVERERLDTAGPVVAVLDRLDDRFMVLNGDVVLDSDLGRFVAAAPSDAAATLALVEVEDPSAYGVVVVGAGGKVDRFVEKPAAGTAPATTVSAGIYVLSRRALAGHRPGALSFERTVFPYLVGGGDLAAVVMSGQWLDIGTGDLYLAAHDEVYRGATSLVAPASPHAAASDPGVAGTLQGWWAWVGPGSTVEHGAVVEESIILPGATIGTDSVVRRSVVGWGASIGSGVVLSGGTLVGERAAIGAGCELTGGARIAPDAAIPPGSITFSPPS